MKAQRGHAALLTSTALLLVGTLLLPGQAEAGPRRHREAALHGGTGQGDTGHGAMLPDPADLEPGDGARAAMSRLVAEPGSVLDAYAPTSGGGGGLWPDAGPGPMLAATGDALPTGSVSTGRAGAAGPVAPAAAPVASPAGPDPLAYGPASPDLPLLDATTLQHAIEAWVGPEPLRGLRSIPAAVADEKRFDARAAVRDFYAARGFAPLWIVDGGFDGAARSALARIDHAAEDGLDLRATPVTVPHGGDPAALATAELSLTEAVVDYARQASGGRVDPARIGPSVAVRPEVAGPAKVLAALRDAADAGEALRGFNPPHRGYLLLRAKLAEMRRGADMAERGPIPAGPALKPGMTDARVPLVRARFGLDIAAAGGDGLVYDTRVASAVADYQRAHGLPASGVLTARTVASLSGGQPKRLEDEIIANMERWRWLPRDLGARYVAVNIPDYSLDVFEGDRLVHHARVVVGKPDHETPVFSETMKFIIVNPYWNVPLSIVNKEMMPKLAANPNYFEDHGYEVVQRNGETYVRQPPGDSNALGRIKFMFPNKFSVYLHDTNARSYFGREDRALSHGCVRVDQPFKLAEAVLGRDRGWSEARVESMVGGAERTVNLPRPVQVHMNYFTAFVDETGQLRLRDDIYGYSAKVRAALGLVG
ncbi:L,D-transpeptidase family protein [Lichenibacterium ramalinae]|uniref:Murein L,D-transpeptidase n=1 Tax=Lichenibacterium ramalinae TaxID=2316527 RepID=A0A4Q2R719_9HYPH|nr:L,D-transpeptidase family protein [Lichenibacterium ramalinae]RYB02391.1 murein L,D-transpeptidase [Lichenibacterium ramalinae]